MDSLPHATRIAVEALRSELAEVSDDNLTLLSIVLADMRPLSAENRTWLADVFDPCSTFDFQINARTLVRRFPGARSAGPNRSWFGWEAAPKVDEMLKSGVRWKRAIWVVAQEYGKSASHIESAVQFWRISEKVAAEREGARPTSAEENGRRN